SSKTAGENVLQPGMKPVRVHICVSVEYTTGKQLLAKRTLPSCKSTPLFLETLGKSIEAVGAHPAAADKDTPSNRTHIHFAIAACMVFPPTVCQIEARYARWRC